MLLEAMLLALQSPIQPPTEFCTSGPEICASRFYDDLPKSSPVQERSDKTSLYSGKYLHGLLGLDSASIYKDHYKGTSDGAAFRKKHPDQLTKALALFGYRYLELKGSIAQGFEFSHISPKRTPIAGYDKYWWSRLNADRGWWYRGDIGFSDNPRPQPATRIVSDCPSATINGYLSPYGDYGHMAGYRRQFVVTEFICD